MENVPEFLKVVIYLLGTPVGAALLGLIGLLVLGTVYLVVYLVKRPDG